MRHYGKSGNQCAPPPLAADTNLGKARELGRSVAFGRVPRRVVRWLGALALLVVLAVAVFSVTNLQTNRGENRSLIPRSIIR